MDCKFMFLKNNGARRWSSESMFGYGKDTHWKPADSFITERIKAKRQCTACTVASKDLREHYVELLELLELLVSCPTGMVIG